jgi:molybdopterin/thiamine biosynthesis adenylyltransferase
MNNIEKGSFRKANLPKLWQKEASNCEVNRFHCVRSTQLEVTARNLDRSAPLSELRIALVGCGTIGGYLARALVQLGAGHKGKLLLIDSDEVHPENLGRHILSVRHLSRNKATALGEQLQSDFPDLAVEAIARSAQENFDRLTGYDIVVDATGDQQFSDSLNAFALNFTNAERRFPPTLFTMIFGNGVAAQSFLTSWKSTSACYRCLKPKFDQDWRFSPVKSSSKKVSVSVRPCSRGAFIPYGVSASMHAAALAASHLMDFVSDDYRDALRSVHIVPDETKGKLRRSVSRDAGCPACSSSRL